MDEQFDLIIIGSGSGNSIPDYLSDHRIALIERNPQFGGTCLNVGCIPSKMFVLPADMMIDAAESTKLGLDIDVHGADWAQIRDRVFRRIDTISAAGKEYRASGSPNVTLIEGTARFADHKTIEVNGRRMSADKFLIAAGARPHVPPIDGLASAGYCTSDTIMRLETFPRRLGVLGGGFIAVEMSHVFSAYGSEVTMFLRGDRVLRKEDDEVARRFAAEFSKRVNILHHAEPQHVERDDSGDEPVWRIHLADQVVEVDRLLVATGRIPNVDLLNLDAAGIKLTDHGVIDIDDQMRTNVEGIWAIGDIANQWQLKHVANVEAAAAFWNIAHAGDANVEPRRVDYSAVPAAVFSHPQIASVGLTEQQARATGRSIRIGTRDYAGTAFGWAIEDHSSFAKVIIDIDTNEIVGAHIMGPQAATLIQPLIQAIQFRTPADQIAHGQFWIHPALTEVVENALLAAIGE